MKTKGRRICRAIVCFLLIGALLAASYFPGLGAREAVSAAQTAISQTEASLIRGQSIQLAVNGTKKKVTWSTSDKKVASVDQTGYVVAKKAGKAVIQAKIGKKAFTCKVTVAAAGLNTADRTVYVGDTLQLEVLNAKGRVAWSTSKKSVATVSAKGKMTVKGKGTATITAKVGKNAYTCKLTAKKAGITREQWINELVKSLNLSVPKKYAEYSFSDIDKSKYRNAIQTAYEHGIIPTSEAAEFCPKAPATREFAAYTAIRGLGTDTGRAKALSCKDKAQITYPGEVSKALELGMLSLNKKNFNPAKEITKGDKKKILAVVKKATDSMTVGKNIQKVAYTGQVQRVEQAAAFTVDNVTAAGAMDITVQPGVDLSGVKKGSILVLPDSSNEDSLAVKVDTITTDSSGRTSISGTEPKLEEVFDSIDIEEKVTADLSGFVANADVLKGVQFDADSNTLKAQLVVDDQTCKGAEINQSMQLGEEIGASFEKGAVTGSITIDAPTLTAIIKANTEDGQKGLTIEQFMLTLSDQVVGTATVSGATGAQSFYLGHLQVNMGKGFKAWLIFNVVFEAEGTATVTCTIQYDTSINYYKGNINFPKNITKSFEGTEASADAKLYLDANLKITWLGVWDKKENDVKWDVEIIGTSLDIGAGTHAKVTAHDTAPKRCTDLDVYVWAAISMNTEKGLGYIMDAAEMPTSWTLLDNNEDNAFRLSWHFEDGKRVEGACGHSSDVYTVKLDANGGSIGNSSVRVKVNDFIVITQTPVRNGYSFDGWYTDKNGGWKINLRTLRATKNLTFYAHWKEAPDIKVSFDTNGTGETFSMTQTYKVGARYGALPLVTKKNCEFLGWYTKPTGGEKITASRVASRKVTELYAHWENVSTSNGYRLVQYTGEQKSVYAKGYPVAYSVGIRRNTLTIYGGIAEYDVDTEQITSRKGYAWREYTIASNAEIASYDESVDDEEEDPWISMDRSDLKEELQELEKGTKIALKFSGGKIVKIIFIE